MAKQKQKEEEIHQVAFTRWFRLQYPHLKDLMTLGPFGENIGSRRMARLKEMGLTPGYADLVFYIPKISQSKDGYTFVPGFLIEMKSKGGKVSPKQKKIRDRLIKMGYEVKIAWSWIEAKEYTQEYLRGVSIFKY